MNFFGIGPLELILILLIILVVVGPAKLPEIASAVGKGMRKFREATTELTKDFKEMAKGVKDAGKEANTTQKPGAGLTKDFKEMAEEVKDVVKEVDTALDPTLEEMAKNQRKESKV